MTYFPDLSPYRYFSRDESNNLLNVGWLGRGHVFPVATPDEHIVRKLGECCTRRMMRTMGYHICEFCDDRQFGLPVQIGGDTIVLGSAEIRVRGEGSILYACPDMIYHYVTQHRYQPPEEFLLALPQSE